MRGLAAGVKLEVQYALQCRHDDAKIKTPRTRVRHVVRFVARSVRRGRSPVVHFRLVVVDGLVEVQ